MKIAKLLQTEIVTSTQIRREYPSNISEAHQSLFTSLLSNNVDSIRMATLSYATVIYSGHIVLNLTDLKGIPYRNDDGEVVHLNFRDIFRIKFLWPKETLSKSEQYLIIHSLYTNTYYHWLVEALPRLFLLRDEITRSALLLPDNHKEQFHRESLAIFEIKQVSYLRQAVSYTVPTAKSVGQIGRQANYNPIVLADTVRFIKSKLVFLKDFGPRIYVSRRYATRRKVVNEAEVEACLSGFGFRVVYFEQHSFTEQVSIMHHCRLLVSIHGAGLTNMIFMQPTGKVLELRKFDANVNYVFYNLAATFGLPYFYQFCKAVNESDLVQDADIHVDIAELAKTVQLMVSKD